MEKENQLPKNLDDFYNKIKKDKFKHGSHNIYLIQTVDIDGNVTDEKYGVNVLTDWGTRYFYLHNWQECDWRLVIGEGTGVPSPSDLTLFQPIVNFGGTIVERVKEKQPLKYDSSTGIITGISRVTKDYFDYNLTGITVDKNITEFGFGNTIDHLIIHSLVYDIDGNPSFITKHVNERLYITSYWCANIHKSVIQNAFDNGIYVLVDPTSYVSTSSYSANVNHCIGGFSCNTDISCIDAKGYYDKFYIRDETDQTKLIQNIQNDFSYVLDLTKDDQRVWAYTFISTDGPFRYYTGDPHCLISASQIIFKRERLAVPEEITIEDIVTDSYDSNKLVDIFHMNAIFEKGYNYRSQTNLVFNPIAAVDMDIQHVYRYNHISKDFDIEESFVNSDIVYDDIMNFWLNIYVTLPDKTTPEECYVYVNTAPSDTPIKSAALLNHVRDAARITLYVTDEYWDVNTWIKVDDSLNIPTAFGTKRYFIRVLPKTSTDNDKPEYSLFIKFNFDIKTPHSIDTDFTTTELDATPVCSLAVDTQMSIHSSDTKSYVIIGSSVIYPEAFDGEGKCYQYDLLPPVAGDKVFQDNIMTHENTIAVRGCDTNYTNQIRIYTLNDDPSIAPTYEDIIVDHTSHPGNWNYNGYNMSSIMSSDGRFIMSENVCTRSSGFDLVLIDLNDSGVITQTKILDAETAAIINGTNYCVYKTHDLGSNTFVIYNMETKLQESTFEIETIYTIYGIVAWKNYVYIRVLNSNDGLHSMIIYDIISGTFTHEEDIHIDIRWNNNHYHFQTYNDEVFVISNRQSDANAVVLVIYSADNPTKPKVVPHNKILNINQNPKLYNTHDSVFLFAGLATNFGYNKYDRSSSIIDVGRIIDKDSGDTVIYPRHFLTNFSDLGYGVHSNIIVPYKHTIICYDFQIPSVKPRRCSMIPCLNHKITGTTTSVQCINSPKRISGISLQTVLSTDLTKFSE